MSATPFFTAPVAELNTAEIPAGMSAKAVIIPFVATLAI